MNSMEIVGYSSELRPHFERLNLLWLEEHNLVEPLDLEYLRDPEEKILAGGGQVFFARDESAVVGTCAAIRHTPRRFELAKLSVDPSARGLGVGRRLCEVVLSFARERGAAEVFLTSNTALATAIKLYESLGFRHEPVPADVRYETADVYMRLAIFRGTIF